MKQIKLTQGQFALVDDADYDWLNQRKWYAAKDYSGDFYATRNFTCAANKQHSIRMSRAILGLKRGDLRKGDHINHNTLDNRRANLRICTNQQNSMNQKSTQNTTSRFKGVSWYKARKKWMTQIYVNGKTKHLGYFIVEEKAAQAYNIAAKKYHKNFAFLNIIP